jgi:hypothetical protein
MALKKLKQWIIDCVCGALIFIVVLFSQHPENPDDDWMPEFDTIGLLGLAFGAIVIIVFVVVKAL